MRKSNFRASGIGFLFLIFLVFCFSIAGCRAEKEPAAEAAGQESAAAAESETPLPEGSEYIRKLISPHEFGGEFTDGWSFDRIEKIGKSDVVIALAGKAAASGLYVWLTKRDDAEVRMGASKNFNIVCIAENKKGLSSEEMEVAGKLMQLIKKNDTGDFPLEQKKQDEKGITKLEGKSGVGPGGVEFEEGGVTIKVADLEPIGIAVLLAVEDGQRRLGMGGRAELGEFEGMLFVFDGEKERRFWMKDVSIPLDLIFADSAGKIVHIVRNAAPESLDVLPSVHPAQYVLEVNGGFAEAHGVGVGDTIVIPEMELESEPGK